MLRPSWPCNSGICVRLCQVLSSCAEFSAVPGASQQAAVRADRSTERSPSSAPRRPMVELTEAEAAVYDRQLRVWGIEVQKRYKRNTVDLLHPADHHRSAFSTTARLIVQAERSAYSDSWMHRLGRRGQRPQAVVLQIACRL